MLEVKDITQDYDQAPRQVLDRVSFTVQEKEVFVIAGRSGSGKSSLLRILGGYQEPQSGTVRWKGDQVNGRDTLLPGHPKMTFLEQEPNLPPRLSIREILLRELRMYDEGYQLERLEELLGFCQIQSPERMPRQLSGGEQQRVGLARAIAKLPEVLLLDEPFAHLDYPNKVRLRELVRKLNMQLGITVLMVTHHIREAFGLADRLLVLEEGRAVQLDTPTKVYNQPQNPQVARLFGATNVLPLRQVSDDFSAHHSGQLAYVPPEFVQLSPKGGQPARIEEKAYMGGYFLVKAHLLDQKEETATPPIYFYTHQEGLAAGHTVQLRFVFRQLHLFESD